jgi:hypothetical protein
MNRCTPFDAVATPPLHEAGQGRRYALPYALRNRRAALVVAHPGHELRVHGWMELAHPTVCILTDGSGHTGQSRLATTTNLLAQSGARPGSTYGRFKDVEVYAAILDNNAEFFTRLSQELCEALVRDSVEYVVGDAIEGYNPIHDLCRCVINAAVRLANYLKPTQIANFDFLVLGSPDSRSNEPGPQEFCLCLDELALERKLTAAKLYLELRNDVSKFTSEAGVAALRLEVLRRIDNEVRADALIQERPFYERYGEKQVEQGYYRRVIRYHEHIFPLAEALENYARI